MRFLVGTHLRESRLDLPKRRRWVSFSPRLISTNDNTPHQPSTSRTGPSSPFFRGEISPLFKERVTDALRSSSPTTPTPPVRIGRGKPRVRRDARESSAGPSSSSTQTPPSSPTSRNTRAAGEKTFPLGLCLGVTAVTTCGTHNSCSSQPMSSHADVSYGFSERTHSGMVYPTVVLDVYDGMLDNLNSHVHSTVNLRSRWEAIDQATKAVPPALGHAVRGGNNTCMLPVCSRFLARGGGWGNDNLTRVALCRETGMERTSYPRRKPPPLRAEISVRLEEKRGVRG